MDENSCENETTESVDDQKEKKTVDEPQVEDFRAKLALAGKTSKHQVSIPYESSVDAAVSGPSTNFYPLIYKDSRAGASLTDVTQPVEAVQETTIAPPIEEVAQTRGGPSAPLEERVEVPLENAAPAEFLLHQEIETFTTSQGESRGAEETQVQAGQKSVGPPPSYSFVMKQKKKLKHVPSPDPLIANRPPPPNYAGSRGLYMTPEDRTYGFPSFAEPIWRSHSQPALCPRCGIIVLTTTHSHESIATHVAALALCLFGCWPCCLLPYCMNVCKNTYHYCPICQAFLGLYTPW